MSDQGLAFAHAVSRLLGWAYFTCWGVSFYPQLIVNIRRKSVTGLALDYFALNVLGFTCYTVSSILFLFSPAVRDEYAQRHPNSPEPTVRWNDLAFAAHAMLISVATWSQFFFWGYERYPSQRLSAPMIIFMIGSVVVVIVSVFMTTVETKKWEWLDVVYTLAYIKLAISLLKYIPQVILNHQRKSTVGWSIHNILLDFSGGILSLAQLVLDSSLQKDWSGLTGNPVKFWLSQIAMSLDIVFVVQHYLLYPVAKDMVDSSVGTPREERGYGSVSPAPERRSRLEQELSRFGRWWRSNGDGAGANDVERHGLLDGTVEESVNERMHA